MSALAQEQYEHVDYTRLFSIVLPRIRLEMREGIAYCLRSLGRNPNKQSRDAAEALLEKRVDAVIQLIARLFEGQASNDPSQALQIPIWSLGFSMRVENCFNGEFASGLEATLGDLLQCSEEDLMVIRNFGKRSLEDLKRILAFIRVSLHGAQICSMQDEPE